MVHQHVIRELRFSTSEPLNIMTVVPTTRIPWTVYTMRKILRFRGTRAGSHCRNRRLSKYCRLTIKEEEPYYMVTPDAEAIKSKMPIPVRITQCVKNTIKILVIDLARLTTGPLCLSRLLGARLPLKLNHLLNLRPCIGLPSCSWTPQESRSPWQSITSQLTWLPLPLMLLLSSSAGWSLIKTTRCSTSPGTHCSGVTGWAVRAVGLQYIAETLSSLSYSLPSKCQLWTRYRTPLDLD